MVILLGEKTMTPEINYWLDKSEIEIVGGNWLLMRDFEFYVNSFHETGAASVQGKNKGRVYRKIVLGTKVEDMEAVLWHELGHFYHPWGQATRAPSILNELAANTWVLKNYKGSRTIESLIPTLKEGLMSYIENGHLLAVDTPAFKQTAKTFGVYDHITWESKTKMILRKISWSLDIMKTIAISFASIGIIFGIINSFNTDNPYGWMAFTLWATAYLFSAFR
jgi:hypothetical protein